MIRLTRFMVVIAVMLVATPAMAVEWESIKTATGTVKNTAAKASKKGGKNSKSSEKPVYVEFSSQAKGFRVKYEIKGAGERPVLKMELEMEVTRREKSSWRRVGLVGRTRGDGQGGSSHGTGPGKYRIVMTGQNVEYNITIEAPAKK